jgi:hypothetical protein
MGAPWPIGPDRRVGLDPDRLAAVHARLAAAERQMAALEHSGPPSLAAAFVRGFGIGALLVVLALLALVAA